MLLKVYSVRDKAVEAFMPPFYERAHSAARRAFEQACLDPNHQFAKNKDDFDLFYMGEFDDQVGAFVVGPHMPERIASGLEYSAQ